MVRAPERKRAHDEGFTLVEVIAAMVILVIIATATVTVINTGLRTVRENADRIQAANIARSQAEALRALGTSKIPIGQTIDWPAGQRPAWADDRFTVTTTTDWIGLGQQVSSCDGGAGNAYMRVHVEVISPDLLAPQVIDTLVSPTEKLSGSLGMLQVRVDDESHEGVSGVSVTGTSPGGAVNNFSYSTPESGCITIPGLTLEAPIQVTIAKPNYVAKPGSATGTSTSVTLTSASTLESRSFDYAEAASLQFASTFVDYPLPADVKVTWIMDVTGATATHTTADAVTMGLWPGTVSAWLGNCANSAFVTEQTLQAGGAAQVPVSGQSLEVLGLEGDSVTVVFDSVDCASQKMSYDLGLIPADGVLRAMLPIGSATVTVMRDGVQEYTGAHAKALDVNGAVELWQVDATPAPEPTPSSSPSGSGGPSASPTPSPSGS